MKRLVVAFVSILVPLTSVAQTELVRANDGSRVSVEVLLPSLEQNSLMSTTGMAVLISGRFMVSEATALELEIPYVRAEVKSLSPFFPLSEQKSSIGNIYVGIGLGQPTGLISAEAGLRFKMIKLENSGASSAVVFSDMTMMDRYYPRNNPDDGISLASIRGCLNVRPSVPGILSFLVRVAPTYWTFKKGDELFVVGYGVGIEKQIAIVTVAAGINGVVKVSSDNWFLNKDAVNYFQAEASAHFSIVRGGIMFRVPLDKELDLVKNVIGLNAAVEF